MKKRKIEKKLVLNKQTIVHLGKEEMHTVKGGSYDPATCVIIDTIVETQISIENSCYVACETDFECVKTVISIFFC